MKNAASLLIFLSALTAFAAGEIKTVVITNSTFSLDVPDHHFLRIYNFTQEGGSTRGVVIAAAATPTATPIATPTPTATATPTPTPTATPTPLPGAVLTATIIDPASPPEFIKPVVVDGPAHVTVDPVPGAKLVLTYLKVAEPTPTPTPTPISIATATPSPTPTATSAPSVTTSSQATIIFEAIPSNHGMTSSPTPTPTPITLESVATSTPTPTPNATPSITPTPSPTP